MLEGKGYLDSMSNFVDRRVTKATLHPQAGYLTMRSSTFGMVKAKWPVSESFLC